MLEACLQLQNYTGWNSLPSELKYFTIIRAFLPKTSHYANILKDMDISNYFNSHQIIRKIVILYIVPFMWLFTAIIQ